MARLLCLLALESLVSLLRFPLGPWFRALRSSVLPSKYFHKPCLRPRSLSTCAPTSTRRIHIPHFSDFQPPTNADVIALKTRSLNYWLLVRVLDLLPGPQKHVKSWPFRLFLVALGNYFTFGVQVDVSLRLLSGPWENSMYFELNANVIGAQKPRK